MAIGILLPMYSPGFPLDLRKEDKIPGFRFSHGIVCLSVSLTHVIRSVARLKEIRVISRNRNTVNNVKSRSLKDRPAVEIVIKATYVGDALKLVVVGKSRHGLRNTTIAT